MHHLTIDSPLGPLTLHATEDSIVGLSIGVAQEHPEETTLLLRAKEQLGEYFAHTRHEFDLPLQLSGTPFQEAIWRTLGTIPYGSTLSYQDLGEKSREGQSPASGRRRGGEKPHPHHCSVPPRVSCGWSNYGVQRWRGNPHQRETPGT